METEGLVPSTINEQDQPNPDVRLVRNIWTKGNPQERVKKFMDERESSQERDIRGNTELCMLRGGRNAVACCRGVRAC
jgi:hypothetical protein